MRASEFTNFTYKSEPYEGWNGDGLVVRAYDGSNEVGHVIFEPTEDDNTQWYAVDVEVEEPYQRKGIASKMYDIAKKAATQQGAIIVKSHTQTDAGRGLWQDKLVWEQQDINEGLRVDVPNEEWLQDAIDYAKSKSPDRYGLPYMGKTTATVRNIDVPLRILRRIPGMRQEQSKIRHHDLAAIRKIMSTTGKLPLHGHTGQEYKPFINVAYDGSAWVNEGNHRIMAAAELGWESLPVEISYFDGGERIKDGPMYPGRIGLGEPIDEEINPDCFNPAFNDTQIFDDLIYRATVEEEYGKPILVIKVFDDFQPVGLAKFKQSKDSVVSLISSFRPEYQGKGIARNVYAYVRMLGNTIKPSQNQLPPGKAMWKSWKKSGDAKHLMKENVIGKLHIDPLTIEIDQHAIDRAGDRNIRPELIDQILRKLPKLVHIMANVKTNKFWVFDPKFNIKIGLAKSDTLNLYRLNTVVKNPTYDSDVPTITLK